MPEKKKRYYDDEDPAEMETLGDDFLEDVSGGVEQVASNGVVLGQDGNDLLIINNGDGSDFLEVDDSAPRRTRNRRS